MVAGQQQGHHGDGQHRERVGQAVGPGLHQHLSGLHPPGDADGVKAAVLAGLHIHFRIPHVGGAAAPQAAEHLPGAGGVRLCGDALQLSLGQVQIGAEGALPHKPGLEVRLVGDDGGPGPGLAQRPQHLRDAGEGLAALGAEVAVDGHIVVLHLGPVLFKVLRREHPADEHIRPVADVAPVLLQGVGGQAGDLQRRVAAKGDIRQGIQQGAVQVE